MRETPRIPLRSPAHSKPTVPSRASWFSSETSDGHASFVTLFRPSRIKNRVNNAWAFASGVATRTVSTDDGLPHSDHVSVLGERAGGKISWDQVERPDQGYPVFKTKNRWKKFVDDGFSVVCIFAITFACSVEWSKYGRLMDGMEAKLLGWFFLYRSTHLFESETCLFWVWNVSFIFLDIGLLSGIEEERDPDFLTASLAQDIAEENVSGFSELFENPSKMEAITRFFYTQSFFE